ncbi:MAG: hypothetical protein U9Q76_08000 [candidate division WOR-3 bacterium]|nr:hypothetical protein [candidate division WOR-3 bacterium]
MKHLKPGLILLGGILLIFSGCQRIDTPQAPTLIAPEDGSVFETEPPTFIWGSDEFADDYVIRIYMGASTDIQDTLEDTTYAMPQGVFETLLNATHNWSAAAMSEEGELFWSESRSFVIDKPEEPQSLDLDTTYFPAGLNYEWVYERHVYGHYYGTGGNEDEFWDYYDTIAILVTDSSCSQGEFLFNLSGGDFHGRYCDIHVYGSLWDVGWYIHVIADSVELLLHDHYDSIFIPLIPQSNVNDFLID